MVVRRMGVADIEEVQSDKRGGLGGRRKWCIGILAVILYIIAICVANMVVSRYGQIALPFTGAVLIPLDMTARNILHEVWRGGFLFLKMGALITTGATISFLLGGSSLSIAIASFFAFALSGAADATTYQLLINKSPMVKMNGSNGIASIVDSVAFPLIAFGSISFGIMIAQAALKFTGGLVWSLAGQHVIRKVSKW